MYYDDALIAAYMQREFGVQLRAISKSGAVCGVISFDAVSLKPDGYTYHIHPDSLAIFEPKDGDVVSYDEGDDWGIYNKYSTKQWDLYGKDIIQRNGKPFFQPIKD